jgi:serine/threonine protein kinase
MGAVYRAIDTDLNRPVALKRLRTTTGLDDTPSATLFKEATTLASLQHPNIVQIYDCGTDAEGPYIVMEPLQGRSLDCFIPEREPLDAHGFLSHARQCHGSTRAVWRTRNHLTHG